MVYLSILTLVGARYHDLKPLHSGNALWDLFEKKGGFESKILEGGDCSLDELYGRVEMGNKGPFHREQPLLLSYWAKKYLNSSTCHKYSCSGT